MRRPKPWWLLVPVLAGSLVVNAYQVLTDDDGARPRRPAPVVQVRPTLPCHAPDSVQTPYVDPSVNNGLCIQLLGSTG